MSSKKGLLLVLITAALTFLVGVNEKWFPDIILSQPTGAWYDTRAVADLATAVTNAGANNVDMWILRREAVNNDLIIPSTVALEFRGSGHIDALAGTVTIQTTDIEAKNRAVFRTNGGHFDFAWGSHLKTSWFDDLYDALIETVDSAATLTVTEGDTLATSASVGTNVVLKWETPGPMISINNAAVTLTVNGDIEAGVWKLFNITAGSVVRGTSDTVLARPDWWEANAVPGTTNMTNAIQAACDYFLGFVGGTVLFSGDTYFMSGFSFYPGMDFEGVRSATVLKAGTPTFMARSHDGASQPPATAVDYVSFEGIIFDLNEIAYAGIWGENTRWLHVDKCKFLNIPEGAFSYTDGGGSPNNYDYTAVTVKGTDYGPTNVGAHWAHIENSFATGGDLSSPCESAFVFTSTDPTSNGRPNSFTIGPGVWAQYCNIGYDIENANDGVLIQTYVSGVPDNGIGYRIAGDRCEIKKPYVEKYSLSVSTTTVYVAPTAYDTTIYGRGSMTADTDLVDNGVRTKWYDRHYYGEVRYEIGLFTDDTTPDVSDYTWIEVNPTGPQTITKFDCVKTGFSCASGKILFVKFENASTTVADKNDGGPGAVDDAIDLPHGEDYTFRSGDYAMFRNENGTWRLHDMWGQYRYQLLSPTFEIADDTTPSVKGRNFAVLNRLSGGACVVKITDFDDGQEYQPLSIIARNNRVCIDDGGNFDIGANWAPDTDGDTLDLIYYNSIWHRRNSDN